MDIPPEAVPDFTILGTAGEGAFGTVLVVRDQTGVNLALKILHHGRHTDRERAALTSVRTRPDKHPGLIDIFHVGTAATGHLYYTMPLADSATGALPGDLAYAPLTLTRYLRDNGPMPPAALRHLAMHLLDAIGWMHAGNIIHRDIKPSNILYLNKIPRLADIGLACSGVVDVRSAGTPMYLPPDGAVGPDADLYALGKVLYECATGADAYTFPSIPRSFLNGPWKTLGPAFNQFLLKACAATSSQRFDTVDAFRGALLQVLDPPAKKRNTPVFSMALTCGVLGLAGVAQLPFQTEKPFSVPASLSPAEQVQAVYAELKRLNPDFPMVGLWKQEEGKVVRLDIPADSITDISPVAALKDLKHLGCGATGGRGSLKSLEGLRPLMLESLECKHQQISDLSPLAHMPMARLEAGWNAIADLRPLEGMPLRELMVNSNPVTDLSPMAGKAITKLGVGHTQITDWTPLQAMPLKTLAVAATGFSRLDQLKAADLEWLMADGCPITDWLPLNSMPLDELMVSGSYLPGRDWVLAHPTLKTVNGQPRDRYGK
jgi:serine/threonine protein kinase